MRADIEKLIAAARFRHPGRHTKPHTKSVVHRRYIRYANCDDPAQVRLLRQLERRTWTPADNIAIAEDLYMMRFRTMYDVFRERGLIE